MKRGFTILELLVATLLLGMLMSILTMLFSQSSVAWSTGIAGLSDLDAERAQIANIRYRTENAYCWDGKEYTIKGLFDDQGVMRTDSTLEDPGELKNDTSKLPNLGTVDDPCDEQAVSVSSGRMKAHTYMVNVKSAGPDGLWNTSDDIWSYPDDPSAW